MGSSILFCKNLSQKRRHSGYKYGEGFYVEGRRGGKEREMRNFKNFSKVCHKMEGSADI